MSIACIQTLQKMVQQLEKERAEQESYIRNLQQIIHLRKHTDKANQTKLAAAVRECKNLEAAFENYVNKVETERMEREKKEKGFDKLLNELRRTA